MPEKPHRGRIQAQGGGTEKAKRWAQDDPPTASAMLTMCDQLLAQLTPKEGRDRSEPLRAMRRFIVRAAKAGGVSAPVSKTFKKPGSRGIRIDLEVITGLACVPDEE